MPPSDDARTSNTLTAYAALRQLIMSGELGAGSNHLESELADRLGMSRTPVREAALMLKASGLLEIRPRKGVRILSLSVADMRDVYDVLTELESLAARRAAERDLTPADLSGLTGAIDDMDTTLAQEDRTAWAEADGRFHRELVRLGGNRRVETIVAMMSDQVHRARLMTLFLRPLPVKSNQDHRAVLDAISKGDAETAGRLHRAHRIRAGRELTALLQGIEQPDT